MMIGAFETNYTTTTIGNSEQPMYHEEMSLGGMIATGISCAILVCILFTCCSKQWDFYLTKKMIGLRATPSRFLHHGGRSSEVSDIEDEWASGSDDSSSESSSIRENRYWINVMVRQLSVCKPSNNVPPNILPPLDNDATCADASDNHSDHHKPELTSPNSSNDIIKAEEESKDDEGCHEVHDLPLPLGYDNTLSKTIRTLLRVASDTYDEYQDTLDDTSDYSSLTFSQATTDTLSKEWIYQHNDKKTEDDNDLECMTPPCNSDDSTVACGNKQRSKTGTGFGSEITIDTTDVEDSHHLEVNDETPTREGKSSPSAYPPPPSSITSPEKSSTSPPSISILVPTFTIVKDELHEFDSQSEGSSNSSLTISDEESQYGILEGRQEV